MANSERKMTVPAMKTDYSPLPTRYSPDLRQQIVQEARSWIGTPYHHQASLKGVGCDCLGLIHGVWRAIYGEEPEAPPPYTPDWAEARGSETLLHAATRHLQVIEAADAGAGDVVLFRWRDHLPAKHCAILTGPAMMIHAHEVAPVAEVPLGPWWQRRMAAAFRFRQALNRDFRKTL